ncbi:hypothetical protein ACAX43_12555 [Paraburkholderia sp. IW21]|uniref:DUF4376 domain-containing protein n=1 Tax=Paraburkholderia sp. IW21 TaxID=3242488 RepID=UPI003521A112
MRFAVIQNGLVSNIIMWDGASTLALPNGATTVQLADTQNVGVNWAYDGAAFSAPPQPTLTVTLDQAKKSQLKALSNACQAQVYAGFTSTALGAAHTYPAKDTDQQNLTASVLSSLMPNLPADWTTPFWCEDVNGAWAYVAHTAAQIQQVGQDGKNAVLLALQKLQTLQAQVAAAATVAAVQAVTW